MKKTMIAALLLLLAAGASAQCETSEGGTASVKIYRAVKPLLEGVFSVTDTTQVRFSKGNLKYQASTGTWDFHESQNATYREGAGNQTPAASRATQSEWIDLFGCCTSGWSGSGAVAYQPWATSTRDRDYGPPAGYSAVDEYAYCDWGRSFYAGYRLLTALEWHYIIYERTNYQDLRGAGTLFGIEGVFLLPDGWSWTPLASDTARSHFKWTPSPNKVGEQNFSANVIYSNHNDSTLWNKMEIAGAVFLPSNGYRVGTSVTFNRGLHYWSSTADGSKWILIHFREGYGFKYPTTISERHYGRAVRLVKDVERLP